MIDTIIASVNQFQSDINSRKTQKGLQQRFDEGWWPGWAPLGYLNVALDGDTETRRSRKVIRKDPAKWDLLKEGLQLYLTGIYSADYISDFLYKKGLRSRTGKKIPHCVMVRTLKNPFYAGLMRWNGQEKTGRHLAMITLYQHRRILEIMDSHNHSVSRVRKHNFLLRGFVFCNICGHRYTAERHPSKGRDYYHCAGRMHHSNQGQNIEVGQLEKQVEEQFKTIEFSREFIDKMMHKLQALYYCQKDSINNQLQVLCNRKKAIEKVRDKAEEKLLRGILSDDDFVRLKTRFKGELNAIQNRMNELNQQRESGVDVIREVIKFAHNIHQTYRAAPPELKRQYLGLFWEKFLVQDKKIVKAVPVRVIRDLQREKKVIISPHWRPSPRFIITLRDQGYMATLRAKVESIKAALKNARSETLFGATAN